MTPALLVLSCAQGASIQDGGRTGWRRQGISTAGAMDLVSLALANACGQSSWRVRAATRAPVKVSPAPMVSTTGTA